MKNLDNIFNILNNINTCLDLATICIYDNQEGYCSSFALGFDASDDYRGDEMEALGGRLHAARSYGAIKDILEALPDRYTVSVENIAIFG